MLANVVAALLSFNVAFFHLSTLKIRSNTHEYDFNDIRPRFSTSGSSIFSQIRVYLTSLYYRYTYNIKIIQPSLATYDSSRTPEVEIKMMQPP